MGKTIGILMMILFVIAFLSFMLYDLGFINTLITLAIVTAILTWLGLALYFITDD